MKHILMMSLGLAACAVASAQTCSGRSPAHTVALVELYTSEGCSSCPPADRFVSALRASGVTPSQAVVLSLHVDYWNDIGWKDPFSSPVFTERQRSLAGLAHSRTTYTPEFFVGGRELRDWRGRVAGRGHGERPRRRAAAGGAGAKQGGQQGRRRRERRPHAAP